MREEDMQPEEAKEIKERIENTIRKSWELLRKCCWAALRSAGLARFHLAMNSCGVIVDSQRGRAEETMSGHPAITGSAEAPALHKAVPDFCAGDAAAAAWRRV
jgi:hypothetical protein